MPVTLHLPTADGRLESYTPSGRAAPAPTGRRPASRVAYAAAHVVADPFAEVAPGDPAAVDWDVTLAFRRHVWACGLGVAEAMDTAQRGMGLDWAATAELIRRTCADAPAPDAVVCGASTDQLPAGQPADLDAIVAAYREQAALVEAAGGRVALMASRHLAAAARGPDDYVDVYHRVLDACDRPVVLHWLGEPFDPALAGYWGSRDLDAAADVVVALCADHVERVDGVKVSLLEADREVALRRRLPKGVRCYTGDDFGYPELIAGDDEGHSDALLGIFDPIAPVAGAALAALDDGDRDRFHALLAPTVPLARHVFAAPTPHYKTGVVFCAWLAGHQPGFRMVGGYESARSVPHLAGVYRLADAAGVLPDPELAAARMQAWLVTAGVAP